MRPTNCAGPCAGCQEESGQRRVVSGQWAVQAAGAATTAPHMLVIPRPPRVSPTRGRHLHPVRAASLCVIPSTRSEAEGRGIPGATDNKGPLVPGQSERRRSWGFLGRPSASGGPRAGRRPAGLGRTLNVSVSFRAPGALRLRSGQAPPKGGKETPGRLGQQRTADTGTTRKAKIMGIPRPAFGLWRAKAGRSTAGLAMTLSRVAHSECHEATVCHFRRPERSRRASCLSRFSLTTDHCPLV